MNRLGGLDNAHAFPGPSIVITVLRFFYTLADTWLTQPSREQNDGDFRIGGNQEKNLMSYAMTQSSFNASRRTSTRFSVTKSMTSYDSYWPLEVRVSAVSRVAEILD
jgi:hypothetical protein